MRRMLVLIALSALVVSSLGGAAGAAGSKDDAALQKALDGLVERPDGPPGVIAIVQRGEESVVLTAGVIDLVSEDSGLGPDLALRAASVAKAFSGAAALSLVKKGEISLDTTIGDLLPLHAAEWGDVTLAQLLGHTSGVPDFIFAPEVQEMLGASPDVAPTPDALLLPIDDEPLEFEPGSKYVYSNSENILVGLMLQAAAGRPYEDILRTEVYEPFGLLATSLPVGTELPEPYLHGYDVDSDPPEDQSLLAASGWAWASGGIVTSANDLNTFIRAYVRGETFGDAEKAAQRDFDPSGGSEPPGPGKNAAGLALFRYKTKCGTVLGHTGNTFGYTNFVAASPDGENSIVISISRQVSARSGDILKALRKVELAGVCAALTQD